MVTICVGAGGVCVAGRMGEPSGSSGRAEEVVRDVEGEARTVADRMSDIIRHKDIAGAVQVFRAIQV